MFKHFTITNFRCFPELHLKELARVNLIAGKNNTGKTALLEAIHLHNNPANPELPIKINKMRGIDDPAKAADEVGRWLFWGRNAQGGLALTSFDEKGIHRVLHLYVLDPVTSRERFPEAEKALSAGGFLGGSARLVLKYEQTNEPERVSIGTFAATATRTEFQWVGARLSWELASVFLPAGSPPLEQDVTFFAELEAAKRQDEILDSLRLVEPRLQRSSRWGAN
ncbi:MAG TPA: AAA family ATPase [Gemmataceae bacterium]|nr:AAA family ATPase [Gemmataceae bacterium]